ncbi:MAG: recombination-associated protein RdgC [bacterium]
MGLIAHSSNISRYQVKDHVPQDYRGQYLERIRSHAFRHIEENSDVDRSVGWVNIMNIFDNEFQGEECFKDEFIALSLRIDTRRIPSYVLKQRCNEAEKEKKAAIGKDFLSKSDREEIKDMIKVQLLKRIIPNIRTFDMIWNIKKGEIFFSSFNDSISGEFQELFKKTFDLNALPLFPYSIAENIFNEEQKNMLEEISSEIFTLFTPEK